MDNQRLAESGLPDLENRGVPLVLLRVLEESKVKRGRIVAVGLRIRMAGGLGGGS